MSSPLDPGTPLAAYYEQTAPRVGTLLARPASARWTR